MPASITCASWTGPSSSGSLRTTRAPTMSRHWRICGLICCDHSFARRVEPTYPDESVSRPDVQLAGRTHCRNDAESDHFTGRGVPFCLRTERQRRGASEFWLMRPRGREAFASGLPALSVLVRQPRAAASCAHSKRFARLGARGRRASGAVRICAHWPGASEFRRSPSARAERAILKSEGDGVIPALGMRWKTCAGVVYSQFLYLASAASNEITNARLHDQ
jgi:hypothetical protein